MRTLVSITAVCLLTGCASVSVIPEAAAVRVVETSQDVSGCRLLGMVDAKPPFIWPGDAEKQLRNNAAALGADTVLLTSHGAMKGNHGAAYRCAAAAP
jgi:hypothetical protein